MSFRKTFATIATVSVLTLTLAACGDSDEAKKNTSTLTKTNTPVEETVEPTEEAPAETEEPAEEAPAETEEPAEEAPAETEEPAPSGDAADVPQQTLDIFYTALEGFGITRYSEEESLEIAVKTCELAPNATDGDALLEEMAAWAGVDITDMSQMEEFFDLSFVVGAGTGAFCPEYSSLF